MIYTQVVSDVDDTLKSSGGVNVGGVALGGIDVQYARGEVYPGVIEFILQMSMPQTAVASVSADAVTSNDDEAVGSNTSKERRLSDDDVRTKRDEDVIDPKKALTASSSSSAQRRRVRPRAAMTPPCVAILTARAKEFKAALKLKDDSPIAVKFRTAGEKAGVLGWGIGPVLYGSVAEWIVQDRKGLRKFTNFELLIRQDPTGTIMRYVYLGDTGELDQEAGETMLREYPEVVKAVFLHYVTDVPGPVESTPPTRWINGRPIVFFRTYVGAAVAAVQLGYMSLNGLDKVAKAAQEQLSNVPKSSDKWIDLNRDLDRAERLLHS